MVMGKNKNRQKSAMNRILVIQLILMLLLLLGVLIGERPHFVPGLREQNGRARADNQHKHEAA